MSEFEWEEPPPKPERRPGRNTMLRFVEQLRERPDEWAIYTRIRRTDKFQGVKEKYPDLELTVRENPEEQMIDGRVTYTVYGRVRTNQTGESA